MTTKTFASILGFCLAVSLVATSPAGANDDIKKQILKLFPQADTNKDGVLDGREAEAFRAAMRARDSGAEMKNPEPRPEGGGVEEGEVGEK